MTQPPLTPALLADDDDEALTAPARRRLAGAALHKAARGRLADPADAVKYIDPGSLDVGAHGETNDTQVAAALDNLLTARPYLAATPPLDSVHFVSPTTEHRQPPPDRPLQPLYENHHDRGSAPRQNRFNDR